MNISRKAVTQATEAQGLRNFPDISEHAHKVVGRWLMACAGMVFGAVFVGGATRLTESGLSITKWDPITGALPPLNEAQWEAEFEKYKQFPEYRYLERELTMSDFKFIYFMEWFHRNWGRATGLVFALPAIYFWRKGYLAKAMKPRILIYGALFLSQAVMGIVMVNSGLKEIEDRKEVPRVSQYKLAAHLGLALFLYVNFLWSGFNHLLPAHRDAAKFVNAKSLARLGGLAHGALALTFFTALSGAFVAGLDAGLVYNSWPKFADRWIPSDILAHEPKWKNFFENHTTVQFNHRHLGELTGLTILATYFMAMRSPLPHRVRLASTALAGMALVQIGLGIATLLTYVPTSLAVSHQSGSVVLLTFATWLLNELKRVPK